MPEIDVVGTYKIDDDGGWRVCGSFVDACKDSWELENNEEFHEQFYHEYIAYLLIMKNLLASALG